MTRSKLVAMALSLVFLLAVTAWVWADQNDRHKTGGGIELYMGVIPAEVIRGRGSGEERSMHGGVPAGSDGYHLVIALFDQASGDRITDARVTARVSVPGKAVVEIPLDPMKVADVVTYGNYVVLSDQTTNRISLQVQRVGKHPVNLDFQYATGR